MTGDINPPQEERIDPREGAVDAARVEALPETLQATADGEAIAAPADPGPQAAPSPDGEPAERLSQLEAELTALRSENESLRGQYMRIAADFDNFRKRQSRDKEDQRLHITCTTLTEILPVVDNFDRARQQLNPQSEEA